MINGTSFLGQIFIDDGKSRATHIIDHAQMLANNLDKSCFACPHLPVQEANRFLPNKFDDFGRNCWQFV